MEAFDNGWATVARGRGTPAVTSLQPLVLPPTAGYDLAADFYDDWKWQHVWARIEWPYVNALLAFIHDQSRLTSILDVGLGTGAYLRRINQSFPRTKMFGIDVSRRMLELAGRKLSGRAHLFPGNAIKLEFRSN